jgi:hypothetical protein
VKKSAIPVNAVEYAEQMYLQVCKDLDAARSDKSHQAVAALYRRQQDAWELLEQARHAQPADPFAGLSAAEIEQKLREEGTAMPLEHLAILARVYQERQVQ